MPRSTIVQRSMPAVIFPAFVRSTSWKTESASRNPASCAGVYGRGASTLPSAGSEVDLAGSGAVCGRSDAMQPRGGLLRDPRAALQPAAPRQKRRGAAEGRHGSPLGLAARSLATTFRPAGRRQARPRGLGCS
eukprot:4593750-Prymnesium_polylepis.1